MISINLCDNEKLDFKWCPPGSYQQSTSGTSLFYKTEQDIVDVCFKDGFWLATVPVTNGQWNAVMGEPFFEFGDFSKNTPVYGVDIQLIQSFLDRVNNIGLESDALKGRLKFSLPNYLESRYASMSRVSEDVTIFWKAEDAVFEEFAWFSKNSEGRIHEVAQKKASPWGHYDMYGNVYEVSSDVKAQNFQKVIVNPESILEGSGLGAVGGGYDSSFEECIVATVNIFPENNEYIEPYGFRLKCMVAS